MKQMSNSLHLKHFVSSPKICAARPGAWPRWGCPTAPSPASTGGLGTVRQEESWVHSPPQQSRQAWFRGGETKGGWNSQFVNLMDPLRLLAAIGVEKDGEGSGKKKKKKTVLSFLILLSLGQRGLGTTGAEQRVNADVSVLRRRVPLAEWTKNFWLFNPNLSQKVIRPMTAGPKPTASPWVTISTDYANKTQDFFEAEACFCSRHPQAIPENHIWCFPSVVPLAFLCISDEIWSH